MVASACALVLLAPVLLAVALAVRLDSRGPVLFSQMRIGRGGRPFTFYKFRSMVVDAERQRAALETCNEADGPIFKIRNDPRVTTVGRFIRRYSLDELPQLFNILRGEMSLVGPRPIVAAEVRRYGRHFVDYCSVRPGMTGIWQISGRNDIGYRRRVAMDCLMARRMSPRLYAEVLIGTARCVVTRQGAY